jgi:hypothetical protein
VASPEVAEEAVAAAVGKKVAPLYLLFFTIFIKNQGNQKINRFLFGILRKNVYLWSAKTLKPNKYEKDSVYYWFVEGKVF